MYVYGTWGMHIGTALSLYKLCEHEVGYWSSTALCLDLKLELNPELN